jgi:hypothetical protein
MNRGQLPTDSRRPLPGNGPERMSGRNTICRNTPSHIMYPTRNQPGSRTEVRPSVRGHTLTLQRAHAPPKPLLQNPPKTNTLDTLGRDK